VLALGIVAHTARATQAKQLARTVRADFISFDSANLLGCDGNHRAVQQHLTALNAPFAVILEDDAEPIGGFRAQLAAALAVAPAPIISLYLGRALFSSSHQALISLLVGIIAASWPSVIRLIYGLLFAPRGLGLAFVWTG